ncbi:carcinoembryonic antigen-related cell adhesion molecule 6 [Fundulus heteroclitus]|uniref:carcinoembryonic antigen-related cell adhesion molecule 6 n=1 Tax=Fundulus heteroclitus TaxID=8078 RepID=UPI00165ADCC7|nr:carcinoembryonic antigen-related cell adhesion molecule 6 [Fundulus heteroclitus]
MDAFIISYIFFGIISGLSEGYGLLEDGPLNASVGGTVMFRTNRPPTEEPFLMVVWNFNHNERSIITWLPTQNNTGPEYEGRITLFTSTGSLELRNLALSDSGDYRVSILPVGENTQIGSTRLDLYEPVSGVTVTPQSADLVEFSGSVSLSCSSSGSSLSFLWMNSSSEVTASDRVQIKTTEGGSTLTIINVTRYDHGLYHCHVLNPSSDGRSPPVNIFISYGPENTTLNVSPSKEHYVEGSDITLACSAESRPSAEFTWFLNGDPLPDTGPELKLKNIQISQSGNYSCQAFNNKTRRDQTSQPSIISVLEPVSSVTVTPQSADLVEFSSSISLFCSASGSSLSFLWMKSSYEAKASNRIQISDGGSTLTIFKVTRYDHGLYSCHVQNAVSNGRSSPVNIFISYGPENTTLKVSPSKEHHEEGSDITLGCLAESRPSAEFTWSLNGNPLPDTGPELNLKNIQISQRGNYSCRAFNNKTRKFQTSQASAVSVLENNKLSGGVIAGIVIACLVVIAAGAAGVCFVYKRTRNLKDKPHSAKTG